MDSLITRIASSASLGCTSILLIVDCDVRAPLLKEKRIENKKGVANRIRNTHIKCMLQQFNKCFVLTVVVNAMDLV